MRRALVVLALVVGVGWAWRAHRSDAGDAKILFHRFWIDHMPTAPKEQFQVLFVNGEHPFGHFGVRDTWEAHLEFFHYHMVPRADGELDLIFGKTNEVQRVKYRARPCREQGFDYCLEIAGSSRGVQRYYSKKEWSFEDVDVTKVER